MESKVINSKFPELDSPRKCHFLGHYMGFNVSFRCQIADCWRSAAEKVRTWWNLNRLFHLFPYLRKIILNIIPCFHHEDITYSYLFLCIKNKSKYGRIAKMFLKSSLSNGLELSGIFILFDHNILPSGKEKWNPQPKMCPDLESNPPPFGILNDTAANWETPSGLLQCFSI